MRFSGSYVALVTPWNKDRTGIDFGALKELIDWQVESGTDGIVPAGTTGESATLSHREHEELITQTVKLVAGRCKVLAGAGSNNTAESMSLAKHAESVGADGILVITPYYNRPTPEGLFRHYGAIAESCGLPIMIYNVPSRTGTNIMPETVIRIAKSFPSVIAIKESSGTIEQPCRIIAELGDKFDVVSGDDFLAVPTIAMGGTGLVSVAANIAPAQTKKMVDAALAGDIKTARELHYLLLPLMKACFVETNPAPAKTALRIMGKIDGGLRLPMVDPKPESVEVIKDALRKVGIVK